MYTVHIQICTSGKNKLQGPASKPVNQLGKFSLVEVCCDAAIFAMKYCMESMNIKEKMVPANPVDRTVHQIEA